MRKRRAEDRSPKLKKLLTPKGQVELVESEPLLPVKPEVQKALLLVGLIFFWVTCYGFFSGSFTSLPESLPEVIAGAEDDVNEAFIQVTCSNDYKEEDFPGCLPQRCGRFVTDSLVTAEEAGALLKVVKGALELGGSDGGASILDLHSGALSKGSAFIDVFAAQRHANRIVIGADDFVLYSNVKERVKARVAAAFGLDIDKLFLTKPTFFSRITPKVALTIHDEYWHAHVDKTTYGSFHYTALVYLATRGRHFEGGEFLFLDGDQGNKSIEPRVGRMSAFTSGSENLHRVQKVRSGVRYALTVAFTCDPSKAISDPQLR